MSRGAATRVRATGILLVALALLASLLVAIPPAQAQPPAQPQQTAFSLVEPFGDAPTKLPDGTPNDLSMLHQMTVEAFHWTPSGQYVSMAVYHSGSRDTSRIKINKGKDAYELHWKTDDLGVVDGQRYRLRFRSAGMDLGILDVRFSDVESDDPRVIEPGDDVKIRFRMAPNALMRARTLSDSRASITEAWHALSEEFDLTVHNRYQILRDEGRRADQIHPYRSTFGTREDKCRTFSFTYDDGHQDAGVWCDSDKDVTAEEFPGLHAESLRLDCKETFDTGQPSKGRSDLNGHAVVSWSIEFLDEQNREDDDDDRDDDDDDDRDDDDDDERKSKSCGGESGIEIVPAAPLHVRGTAWSADDLAMVLIQEGGATIEQVASWMYNPFGRPTILQAIVRSPATPSVEQLIRLALSYLFAPSNEFVFNEIRQITLADGSPAFTPSELLVGYLGGNGALAGVLDRVAIPLGLDAAQATAALHEAGVTPDDTLVQSMHARGYEITAILDGIRRAWWGEDGEIPQTLLDGARESVIRTSCRAGLTTDTARAEAARLLARAYVGATTAEDIAPVIPWYGDCRSTLAEIVEVITAAFPDMAVGDVAQLLIDSSVPRTTVLREFYLRGASLADVGDLVHQTASDPLPLPDVVEDLKQIVLPDGEPNPVPDPPSPEDVFWAAVDSMDSPVPPCETILAGHHVMGFDPVTMLTGAELAAQHPTLFDPATMTTTAGCFIDHGIDFAVPLEQITVEFTGYMPPTTSLGVPKGVMTGHVGVSFPGLDNALVMPALPAIVAHQADSFWYGTDCCGTARFGYTPADRAVVDPRQANQSFGLDGALHIIVPDLPDDLPGTLEVPEVALHAGFYTDPRLGCDGNSPAAGMAAAAQFPAELYPNSPLPFREVDQMAFGSITRSLTELQAGGTIRVPQYATTPGINACSRITHDDPRLEAQVTVTVADIDATAVPSMIHVPWERHNDIDWGLELQAARIGLSGPGLLLLLANHNALPANGQALADYLQNGS